MSPRFIDKSIHNIDLRRNYRTLYGTENGLENGLYVLNSQRKMGSLIRNPKVRDDFRSVMLMSKDDINKRRQVITGMMNGEDMLSVPTTISEDILPLEDVLVIPSGMLGKGFTFDNNN